MHKYVLALYFGVVIGAPANAANAADDSALVAVVQRSVDGFNHADARAVAATCAREAVVIDDFPPHAWQGPHACARWFKDFESMSKVEGIANARIAVDPPSHIEISKDVAYLVIPAKLSFDRKGAHVTDVGIMTVTLRNGESGWRISGWVWSDR